MFKKLNSSIQDLMFGSESVFETDCVSNPRPDTTHVLVLISTFRNKHTTKWSL